jgi:hypothetical protein
MEAQIIHSTRNTTQLMLDHEALSVIRAALEFTAKLNRKCHELAVMLAPCAR